MGTFLKQQIKIEVLIKFQNYKAMRKVSVK